jgi:E3 ubiquitin-protein ligase MYCBP2
LLDEAVPLLANNWYVGWARVSGPSSDCGSAGQSKITTDDDVTFHIKSSRKSNNGTDLGSGQIPAILYKLPSFEKDTEEQTDEPVHILDRKFSRTVTVSNFDSLLGIMRWAWSAIQQHSLTSVELMRAGDELAAVQDIEKYSFIAVACLKLLKTYICEVYPSRAKTNKTPPETEEIATAVLDTRLFLSTLLEGSVNDNKVPPNPAISEARQQITLKSLLTIKCRDVFLDCFHAFYPTGPLKWLALSELLQQVNLTEHGAPPQTQYQLGTIMDALSSSRVRLSSILPTEGEESGSFQAVHVMSDRQSRFPLLEEFMTLQTGIGQDGGLSFKQVVSKLLTIVAAPVHCETEKGGERKSMASFPDELVKSSGRLISSIVGELALSATLSSSPYETSSPQMQESPSRFGNVQQTNWNTGNGSADAIAFKIDRSGVTLVGVGMYGGGGSHRYELELLLKKETVAVGAGIFGGGGDGWKPVAHIKGEYGDSDCNSEKIAHLMFKSPIAIEANTVYAIRFRNHGNRTANGTTGRSKVTCSDGMVITWLSSTLSSNGTGENRGQIPTILYCTSSIESLEQPEAPSPAVAENLRQSTITIVTSVLEIASDLLDRASEMQSEMDIHSILSDSYLFKSLLPLLLAQLGPVAASTPQTSVEVLEVINRILPSVTNLSQQINDIQPPDQTPFHHMIVESDHPYKPGVVNNYRVTFPESVQWLVLEFDAQSATAQAEDRLNVLIPRHFDAELSQSDVVLSRYWSVLKPFSGAEDWPKHAVVLPGHEVVFSLETASEYSKDESVSRYGFKCNVVGQVWQPQTRDVILLLEKELAYLAGMCAGSLMKSDLPAAVTGEGVLPADETEEQQVARQLNDAGAQYIMETHLSLIGRGLSLENPITVQDALTGELHFAKASSEKDFLIQFLECTQDTSGGRLARWLQPDAFVDPAKSEVILSGSYQVGCLAQIGLQTKDRLGTPVHVSGMRVVLKGTYLGNKKPKPFGSAPPEIPENEILHDVIKVEKETNDDIVKPEILNAKYKETLQGTKDKYVSMSMMKEYQNFSFEELRFHTPAHKRPDQSWSLDMQDNQDGTYIAGWIPNSRGSFNVEVSIDGTLAGSSPIEVDVEDAVGGMQVTAPVIAMPVSFPQKLKVRKFVAPAKTGGLRIRSQPSLQSEELGVIRPDQKVAFTEEVTNEDGTWIKLTDESIVEYTEKSHEQAWCLSFHKKLNRQLMVDVEEPVMTTQPIPVVTAGYSPSGARKMRKKWIGGAGEYEVIRCGEAGHNIRNRPSLKGTPVGLLCRRNRIKASNHVNNSDGDWLKLERDSVEKYCEKEGEAWTLSRTVSGIVYLEQEGESEYETDSESDEESSAPSAATAHPQPGNGLGLGLAPPFMHPPAAQLIPPMPGVGMNQQQFQNIMMRQLQEHQQQEGGLFFPLPIPRRMLFGGANNAQPPPPPPQFVGPFGGIPLFDIPPPQAPVDNAQVKGDGFRFGRPFGGNVVPAGPAFGFGQALQEPAPPVQFSFSPVKETDSDEDEKKDKGFGFGAAAAASAGDKAASPIFTLGLSPQKSKHQETTKKSSRFGRGGKVRSKSPARFGGKTEKGGGKERGKVCKALSPAVAKCMRAVFAAFMWHEGITHDAMACASYLKFHPELTKDMGKQKDQEPTKMESEKGKEVEPPKKKETDKKEEESKGEETLKKEETVKKEEPDSTKQKESEKTKQETEETDKPETKQPITKALDRKEPEKKEPTVKSEPTEITKEELKQKDELAPEMKLPPTLRHLVAFWDELASAIQLATSKKLPQPKVPELKIRAKIVERPETEQPVVKQQPKPKPKVAGPGHTICELCDDPFPNPVTYHMKREHPGCGKHAAGQGYNSGGTYCGGWAGNCGDGGHGGSTWYLMCNSCHDKYLDQKKELLLAQDKRVKQGGVVIRMTSGKPKFKTPALTDSHAIITENCKFLLELESAGESKMDDLRKLKSPVTTPLTDASLEDPLQPEHMQSLDSSSFRQFQYLQRGISVPGMPVKSPVKDKLLEEKRSVARSVSIEDQISKTLDRGKARTLEHLKEKNNESERPLFLPRSMSIASGTIEDKEGEEANKAIKQKHSPVDGRRKQILQGPANLVERMSPKLYKLVQRQQAEAEKDKQSSPSEMALKRPLLAFICQQLDLDCIRRSMIRALKLSACRVHAMKSFEWYLRQTTQTTALHDLMWFFAASLTPPPPPDFNSEDKKEGEKKEKEEVDLTMGEHPTEGLVTAGDGLIHLTNTFHDLLRTIADLMGELPQGSAAQQMAMRCWCLHFKPGDHTFLHRSYVFSRINQMLTHVDEDESRNNGSSQLPAAVSVVLLPDLLSMGKVTASSRPAMLDSLSDGSTETFWESGDEDKHRSRWLQVVFEQPDIQPEIVYIHIDNCRDSGNRTEFVTLNVGNSIKTLKKVKEADVPYRFGGWLHFDIPNPSDTKVIKLDLKGTQNSLRIRQLKIQGYADAASKEAANITSGNIPSPIVAQRKQCEAETLRVFRLLTSQVFGKLVAEQQDSEMSELKEHVVGILFGQSKLSSLQKQVCEHIVDSIRSEAERVREEWEAQLNFPDKPTERLSDTYCFELLSMVLALSGSDVGRAYVAEQYSLLTNLLSLLHTGTARIQCQVVSVLRRILPLVSPHRLAHTLGITSLPKPGFSAVTEATDASGMQNNLEKNPGILDVLLAVVAKALSVQVKSKGAKKGGNGVLAGKGPHTVTVMSLLTKPVEGLVTNETLGQEGSRWWLRGQMQAEVATEVIKLLNDMSLDKISKDWTEVTRAGVGEAVLSLTKLDDKSRRPMPCMYGPIIWLTLSSLCVLTEEHVEQLSSGQWSAKEEGKKKPTCDNHDDGETIAIIECDSCGNLCAECDRVLHFSKKNKAHSRTVFKEEEEAVKVDLNEGCGRTKLFWVMVLADSRTLKAMVEFKDTGGRKHIFIEKWCNKLLPSCAQISLCLV